VAGKSLIAHAAATVATLPWLDAAILSTDDAEIVREGRAHGLAVPFLRPAELASDTATGVDAWRHAWRASEAHYDRRFDCSVLLQPTSPLRKPADVERTIDTMLAGGHQAATTVSRVPGHYVPQKLLRLENGILGFLDPEGARHSNRQSAPACYTRNGLCYAAMREAVVERGEIIERDCVGIVIDGFVVNIDEKIDLEIAEMLAGRDAPQG
jgi:CMP-N-acetylneuraminic acid synthetase